MLGGLLIGLAALAFTPVSAQSHQALTDTASTKKAVFVGDLQLCADSVEAASVAREETTGQMVVYITLRPASGEVFGKMTEEFLGKPLPITLDGKVVIAPTVHEPIFGGAIQISGATVEEQTKLVAAFSAPC